MDKSGHCGDNTSIHKDFRDAYERSGLHLYPVDTLRRLHNIYINKMIDTFLSKSMKLEFHERNNII